MNVLHCVDAGVMLNFQLSHGDNNTAFKNQLEEFLSLAISRKRKKTEDSSLSVQVNAQSKKMLTALGKGVKVSNIEDIKKYFSVKFIIKAFVEYQNKIIWDEETKATTPSKEESDQHDMPTGGSVAPQPSDEADKSIPMACEPTLQKPTPRNVPSTSDEATGITSPFLSAPTTPIDATPRHSASETTPQQSIAAQPELTPTPSGHQGAYL